MGALWNIFALILMIFAVYAVWVINKDYAKKGEAPLSGSFFLCFFVGIFFLYRFMPVAGFAIPGFLDVCLLSATIAAVWWVCCFVWHSVLK